MNIFCESTFGADSTTNVVLCFCVCASLLYIVFHMFSTNYAREGREGGMAESVCDNFLIYPK